MLRHTVQTGLCSPSGNRDLLGCNPFIYYPGYVHLPGLLMATLHPVVGSIHQAQGIHSVQFLPAILIVTQVSLHLSVTTPFT